MKCIINTALSPHFCIIFDDTDTIVEVQNWDNLKLDGKNMFEILGKYSVHDIDFVGWISGPGGFSSLRAGSAIINALAFATQKPIHQIRADQWIRAILKNQGISTEHFVLNSFSDFVFITRDGILQKISIDEAVQLFRDIPVFVDFLPEEKKGRFLRHQTIDVSRMYDILLSELQQLKPCDRAIPDYMFDPV
jgi:hypothetical protein